MNEYFSQLYPNRKTIREELRQETEDIWHPNQTLHRPTPDVSRPKSAQKAKVTVESYIESENLDIPPLSQVGNIFETYF